MGCWSLLSLTAILGVVGFGQKLSGKPDRLYTNDDLKEVCKLPSEPPYIVIGVDNYYGKTAEQLKNMVNDITKHYSNPNFSIFHGGVQTCNITSRDAPAPWLLRTYFPKFVDSQGVPVIEGVPDTLSEALEKYKPQTFEDRTNNTASWSQYCMAFIFSPHITTTKYKFSMLSLHDTVPLVGDAYQKSPTSTPYPGKEFSYGSFQCSSNLKKKNINYMSLSIFYSMPRILNTKLHIAVSPALDNTFPYNEYKHELETFGFNTYDTLFYRNPNSDRLHPKIIRSLLHAECPENIVFEDEWEDAEIDPTC